LTKFSLVVYSQKKSHAVRDGQIINTAGPCGNCSMSCRKSKWSPIIHQPQIFGVNRSYGLCKESLSHTEVLLQSLPFTDASVVLSRPIGCLSLLCCFCIYISVCGP